MAITAVAVGQAVGSRTHAVATQPDFREALVVSHRPVALNPLVSAADPGAHSLGSMLYRRLLRLDGRAMPVPDLAASVTVSPDGLSYLLPLKSGLRWSDGHALTAGDVVATLAFIESPRFRDHGVAALWKGVTVAAGQGGVVFSLGSPRASFAAALTELPVLPLGSAMPATLAAAYAGNAIPTSGPYTVSGSSPAAVELTANPHSDVHPQLPRLELKLADSFGEAATSLRSGGIDAVLAATPQERADLLKNGRVTAHDVMTFRFVDLMFNERVPGLDDPDVRRAVAAGVDRASLIRGPLGGLAAGQAGPIPAGILWANPVQSIPGPNPGAAAASLDAGGWARGPDGVRSRAGVSLRLALAVPDADPLPAVGRAVAAQLSQIGIAATLTIVPAASYLAAVITPHNFQLAIADWDNSADPDISSFWRSSSTPPQGVNVFGAVDDPFLDRDLDDLATVSDVDQRKAAAARVTSLLTDAAPAVFLYAPKQSLMVNSAFSGVTTPPVGDPYANVATWHR